MMTFLQRLKVVANTRERGKPENLCTVRREDLAALIHHFERLDSEVRARQEVSIQQHEYLQAAKELSNVMNVLKVV